MVPSLGELQQWFNEKKAEGFTHMLVVCDTFDYEDYPVGAKGREALEREVAYYRKASMQKIMEIYDLSIPFSVRGPNNRRWDF